jgi:hypothetical protein
VAAVRFHPNQTKPIIRRGCAGGNGHGAERQMDDWSSNKKIGRLFNIISLETDQETSEDQRWYSSYWNFRTAINIAILLAYTYETYVMSCSM